MEIIFLPGKSKIPYPKYEASSEFFSSRRGLLSSHRGLSKPRCGLLSSRRELKNWMQEQHGWFTYF